MKITLPQKEEQILKFWKENKIFEKTLEKKQVHHQWESDYRSLENEKFYEEAFRYIANVLDAPKNSTILDVGCGIGAHSIRLLKYGFTVTAVDFSTTILKTAEDHLQSTGHEDKIKLQRENLLSLSFPDKRLFRSAQLFPKALRTPPKSHFSCFLLIPLAFSYVPLFLPYTYTLCN